MKVALFLREVEDTKNISKVFREIGIVPYYFEEFQDFWESTTQEVPSLAIVDVRKMSEGNRRLRDHPHVKTGLMPLAFFFTEETIPLLHSTYQILHYGLIRQTANYRGPIKSVLMRLNKMRESDEALQVLHKKVRQANGARQDLIKSTEQMRESEYYGQQLRSLCRLLHRKQRWIGRGNFFNACSETFNGFEGIAQFMFLEIGGGGQKLISPPVRQRGKKQLEFSGLHTGVSCEEGIPFLVQNMAAGVALEMMEGEVISILVRGGKELPEKLIYIRPANQKYATIFDWALLEHYLTGFYCEVELQVQHIERQKDWDKILNPWQLFSLLDKNLPPENESESESENESESSRPPANNLALIDVNFTALMRKICQTHQQGTSTVPFPWDALYTHFLRELEEEGRGRISFQAAPMGIVHLALITSSRNGSTLLKLVKSLEKTFPYWHYFDENKASWAWNLAPTIQMLPPSSWVYWQHLAEGHGRHQGQDQGQGQGAEAPLAESLVDRGYLPSLDI